MLSLKKVKIPHIFIFLSGIILFCSILTYIIPSGSFDRGAKEVGGIKQTIVVPGTYKEIPKHFSAQGLLLSDPKEDHASPTSLLGLFTAIPKGLVQSAALIFFIFIVGAVFAVIQKTGAIDAIVFTGIEKLRDWPLVLFFFIYLAISTGAAFMGIHLEYFPLIPLFLLLAREFKYDRMFGIGLIILPVSTGWATAITNPFTVQIAQKVAEVPIGSGIPFRTITFIIFLVVGFIYLMRYGRKVRLQPHKSMITDDSFELEGFEKVENPKITRTHLLVSLIAITLFATILYAVQELGWGLVEMTGGFFALGLITILVSRMPGSVAMEAFTKGLETMIIPALIVGFARGIQVVLVEAQIIDTILHSTALILQGIPQVFAAEGMFFFQSILNFFIPSASGQALVTMPLMTPLADLLSLSRQVAVLAFTLGDGLSNLIIPTNGVLMAMLGIATVPYEKWVRFVAPLFIIYTVMAFIIMYVAVAIGF